MQGVLYLAIRYLWAHRLQTALLVSCLGLTLLFPIAVNRLFRSVESSLTSRAEQTPLVIGAPGGRLDLVLHAVYFDGRDVGPLTMQEAERVEESGLGQAIPIHYRFQARGVPVIGTTNDYYRFRNLQLDRGAPISRIGDCILGSQCARKWNVELGDFIVTDSLRLVGLSQSQPLRLRVVGVLQESHSPDDETVFVNLETVWIIEGIGHRHASENQPPTTPGATTPERADSPWIEITDENIKSFHFHGVRSGYPITAVIVLPQDEKSATILLGRYQTQREDVQIQEPSTAVGALVHRVVKIRQLLNGGSLFVAVVSSLFFLLVVILSLQLRQSEIAVMRLIGCSRFTIARLIVTEYAMIIALSLVVAMIGLWLTNWLGEAIVRDLIW